MDTITLTINGRSISAVAGQTILEVAARHGIKIPTLCHHEALRPIGACRLCQVEDEKRGVVVPACVTKISPGMVIETESERVRKNRRNIIRLLMAAHPESCVVCEKGNTCELRRLAAEMGVGRHGLDPMPFHPLVMDLNPFLTRDLSKCIMCAKCVRVDQEVVCEGVIDYNLRGFTAHPATLFGRPLEASQCTFCGSCLTVCPVGAIAEKDKPRLDHAGARRRSVCSFCACGCSIYLEHDHNSVRSVSPTALAHTANGVTLCVKGHFGHDHMSSPDRLRTPLLRTEDGLQPASWDQALDYISAKMKAIKESHGPDALGFMGGARSTNEENYLFQKLARCAIGTNNIDFSGRAKAGEALDALWEATGFAAATGSFKDIESSDAILLFGTDPSVVAPVLGYHIKRAARVHGKKLIVIDPLRSRSTGYAGIWLQPALGTEARLLQGMIAVILEEDLTDRQFVAAKTREFDDLAAAMAGVSVSDCASACGVPEDALREAARVFANASTGYVVFGNDAEGAKGIGATTRLILGLIFLTGNLGKDRSGFLHVLKEANAQGALDMGVRPDGLPGQRPLSDEAARSRLAGAWGVPPPESAGLNSWEMIEAARDGKLQGLYVLNENPAVLFPDEAMVRGALAGLPLLVVQDMFLTETAKLAHVVLPAAAWAEKDGTVTNMERRVQRLSGAVLPPGEFPPDLEVITAVAGRLGLDWPYKSPDDVLKEIERVVPLYGECGRADLNGKALFWPPLGMEEVTDTLPHGIGHADGKAVFLTPGQVNGAAPEDAEYPFMLIAGGLLQHLGSGSRTARSKRLGKMEPSVFVGLHPDGLEELGLNPGDRVRVVGRQAVVEVPVRADERLPGGAVFMPVSIPGERPHQLSAWNARSGASRDDIQHCRVRLEKV